MRRTWQAQKFLEDISRLLKDLPYYVQELVEDLHIYLRSEQRHVTGCWECSSKNRWKRVYCQASGREQMPWRFFEKGDREIAMNYRPVNLTTLVCKTLERIIIDRMGGYL